MLHCLPTAHRAAAADPSAGNQVMYQRTSPESAQSRAPSSTVQAASMGGLIEASFQGFDAVQAQLPFALGVYKIDVHALKRLRPDVILTQLQVRICAVI